MMMVGRLRNQVGNFQGTVLSIDSRYVRLETENKEMVLMPSYQV